MKSPERMLTEWSSGEITFDHDVLTRDEFSRYVARLGVRKTVSLRMKTFTNPLWDEVRKLEESDPDGLRAFFEPTNVLKYESVAEVKDALRAMINKGQFEKIKPRLKRASELGTDSV